MYSSHSGGSNRGNSNVWQGSEITGAEFGGFVVAGPADEIMDTIEHVL